MPPSSLLGHESHEAPDGEN